MQHFLSSKGRVGSGQQGLKRHGSGQVGWSVHDLLTARVRLGSGRNIPLAGRASMNPEVLSSYPRGVPALADGPWDAL